MEAARQLADFRAGVKDETFTGETQSRNVYNRERSDFGRKTGLSYSFPAWTALSDESKKLFTSLNKTNTVLEQDMAFRAVKKQIQVPFVRHYVVSNSCWCRASKFRAQRAKRFRGQLPLTDFTPVRAVV
jgi:hypothetical protein